MTALSKEVDAADGGQFNRKNLLQDPALTPPTDPEYMRRISETIRKRMRITRGVAKLSQVVAHNLEFCIGLPHKDIRSLTQRIIRGYRPELTVYWRNEHFVMSDDYFAFLAYRQAGVTSVPLAILGCFPPRAAETIARGGIELLPPIEVMLGSVSTSRSAALEEWLANHRANAKGRRAKPADLAAAWLVFADHIAHSETTEADVHKYLLQFPVIIATGGKAVESEVWLGKTYKMDLVVRYTGVIEEALLIELENPQHFIFTRNGRPRKAVTHARQQVEDWLRWVRENPADAFVQTLAGVPPKGLVVIGKSRNLSNDERRRLAHLNIGGNVAIVTYDQLLERFGDLILQQCDDTRD